MWRCSCTSACVMLYTLSNVSYNLFHKGDRRGMELFITRFVNGAMLKKRVAIELSHNALHMHASM